MRHQPTSNRDDLDDVPEAHQISLVSGVQGQEIGCRSYRDEQIGKASPWGSSGRLGRGEETPVSTGSGVIEG